MMRISLFPTNRSTRPKAYLFSLLILFFFFFYAVPAVTLAAETYVYDEYNRLVRAHDGTVNVEYDYDGTGNRIAMRSDNKKINENGKKDGGGSGGGGGCFITDAEPNFNDPTRKYGD